MIVLPSSSLAAGRAAAYAVDFASHQGMIGRVTRGLYPFGARGAVSRTFEEASAYRAFQRLVGQMGLDPLRDDVWAVRRGYHLFVNGTDSRFLLGRVLRWGADLNLLIQARPRGGGGDPMTVPRVWDLPAEGPLFDGDPIETGNGFLEALGEAVRTQMRQGLWDYSRGLLQELRLDRHREGAIPGYFERYHRAFHQWRAEEGHVGRENLGELPEGFFLAPSREIDGAITVFAKVSRDVDPRAWLRHCSQPGTFKVARLDVVSRRRREGVLFHHLMFIADLLPPNAPVRVPPTYGNPPYR